MHNSFICWANASHKKVVAVVKFHPFSSMDPDIKDQYEFLSQNLVDQSNFQNSNKKNGPAILVKCTALDRGNYTRQKTKMKFKASQTNYKRLNLALKTSKIMSPKSIILLVIDLNQSLNLSLMKSRINMNYSKPLD